MVRFLESGLEQDFLSALLFDSVEGARIYALYKLCNNTPSVLFWVQYSAGLPVAALAGHDGALHLSASESADKDELREFISFMGFKYVYAPSVIYDACIFDCDYHKSVVMELGEAHFLLGDSPIQFSTPSLMDVYRLLYECSPEFAAQTSLDSWYVHTSLLLRRGLGHCYGIYRDGRLVSTAGVYAMSTTHALIGGVATLADYRRQGLADSLVKSLITQLRQSGLTPIILSGDNFTHRWYNRLGFIPSVNNYAFYLERKPSK